MNDRLHYCSSYTTNSVRCNYLNLGCSKSLSKMVSLTKAVSFKGNDAVITGQETRLQNNKIESNGHT